MNILRLDLKWIYLNATFILTLMSCRYALASEYQVGGELGIGIVAEAFRNGSVNSELNVGITSERKNHWNGQLEIRKKAKDTKIEASQILLNRVNEGGSTFSLGLMRKNMGLEASRVYSFPGPFDQSKQSLKRKWPAAVFSPVYEKLESLGYINTEPRMEYSSPQGETKVSIGIPQSTNVNLLAGFAQKVDSELFYGYEFRQDLLVQTEKLVDERLIGGAVTLSLLGYLSKDRLDSDSISIELISGLDSARTAFLREIGNNRKSYFASFESTYSAIFYEEASYFWQFYSRLSRFTPDVKELQKRVDEIALGVEFVEGPVRLSSAIHWQLQTSGSKKGSYNMEGSKALVKATYYL
jgi:hypothetical protein